MKLLLTLITVGMAISCNEMDSFRDTIKYFETDKTDYCPGDTIRITAIIASNAEKKVRIFKNYRNLILTIVLKDTCQETFGEKCHGWVPQNIAGKEKTKIQEHIISPGHPFKKTFVAYLKKAKGHHVLWIPELKHSAHIRMDTASDKTIIGIAGRWNPANRRIPNYEEGDIPLQEIALINDCH